MGHSLCHCQSGPVCALIIDRISALNMIWTSHHRLGRADLRRKRGSGGARFHEDKAHVYTFDACLSKSSGSRCEFDGRLSRWLFVHLSSYTHGLCVAPAPLHHCSPARAIHGYCDHRVRSCLLGFSFAYDCTRVGHLWFAVLFAP